MRRSRLIVALAALIVLCLPSPVEAQTLVPDLSDVLGGDSPSERDDKRPAGEPCGHGVTFICAGETLVDGATDVGGAAVDAAGDAVMGGIVSWAASGASWLVTEIGRQIERSTRPAIGSAWFQRHYRAVRELAIAVSALFLLAAILHAVLRQDMRMLGHAVGVALPLSLLLTFAALTLVELALALTDWMTTRSLAGFGADANEAFSDLGEVLTPTVLVGNPLPGLVLFMAAMTTAILALIVWTELVLREASIYLAVTFLPLSFVAMVWRPTAHWARRLAEWLGAIILSKVTIAVAFAVAGSALGHAGEPAAGGLTVLLAGCAVLLLAAMSPWVLLRLIPGHASSHALHRGVVRGAAATAPGAGTATMVARQAIVHNLAPAVAAGVASRAASTPSRPSDGPPRPPAAPTAGGPRLTPPADRHRVESAAGNGR